MIGANLPTLEIAGVTLGLREGIFIVVGFVALYMALVLWRMRRLMRSEDSTEPVTAQHQAPVIGPVADLPELQDTDEETGLYSPSAEPSGNETVLPAQWPAELLMLRDEVEMLRGELAALREDMHQELAHLRASQTVSPIYGDAMQMASAGYDAAMIAERCGIARAEAELVVALTKSELQ